MDLTNDERDLEAAMDAAEDLTGTVNSQGMEPEEVLAAESAHETGAVRVRCIKGRAYVAVGRIPGRGLGWVGFTADGKPKALELKPVRTLRVSVPEKGEREIRTEPRGLLEPPVVERVHALQEWLEAQPEVDHTFSYVDYLRRMHQAMHDDDPRYRAIPETQQRVASYLLLFEDSVVGRLEPFLYPDSEEAEEARVLVMNDPDGFQEFMNRLVDQFVDEMQRRIQTD